MNPDTFRQQIAALTARLAGRPLDTALDAGLNAECGPGSPTYREPEARCDGRPAGWVVMPPGSAHRPSVNQGRALGLYLLPQGRIDFTRE